MTGRRIMTADGVMVLVNGTVLDRDGVVASLDGAPAWSAYDLGARRLVDLGEGGVDRQSPLRGVIRGVRGVAAQAPSQPWLVP